MADRIRNWRAVANEKTSHGAHKDTECVNHRITGALGAERTHRLQRAARRRELRFFAGLTVEETAAALRISPASVKREWSLAKGWLYRELTGGAPAA